MPVTWELGDRLLVVTLIGNYAYEDPARAVRDAMREPSFRPDTMLLIDARLTTTRRSSEEFRDRAIWMKSLTTEGLAPRCAIVIGAAPHQFGRARMAATYVEMHGMELKIFTEMDEASQWLRGEARSSGVGL